ncbi:hypothetical protein V8B97DRAFT_1958637 [Scleroderma yunnanense]
MDVIDLSSSPEPIHQAKKRQRRVHAEVVEIMSDEDEGVPLAMYKQNRTTAGHAAVQAHAAMGQLGEEPQMGDAAQAHDPPPLFYPVNDSDDPPLPLVHSRPATPQPEPLSEPVDPRDAYIARVIEIVPDVQPAHVLGLVEQFIQSHPEHVVELVLHALFEDPSYPKIDRKGKRKRDADEDDKEPPRASPKPKIDYLSPDRMFDGGPYYFDLSMGQLMVDFPRIPKPHIRKRLLDLRFYARTFFQLRDELAQVKPPFKLKTINSVVSGKGKARQDDVFTNELAWLKGHVTELEAAVDQAQSGKANEEQDDETGDGIECGCCFSSYAFDKMVQCPEAHLFCMTCMTSYSSTLLGEHNPNIVCMDQSGCKLPFPESELKRFLSSRLLELYERVKQRKEIEAAGLENLEECPFCEYKCVIDNEAEKLFRCENTECAAVTCRACKKPDHLPKSCKEVDEDQHLDAQHVIEEAMTRALMRNCPKCQKAFIKEHGCNKMACPNCHTTSCYVCRKVIDGYSHFDESTRGRGRDRSKCALWDTSVDKRHADEVSAAAKRALDELKSKQPWVDVDAIKVDIPVASAGSMRGGAVPRAIVPMNAMPPLPARPRRARGRGPRNNPHVQVLRFPVVPPPYHGQQQPQQQQQQQPPPPLLGGMPFMHAPLQPFIYPLEGFRGPPPLVGPGLGPGAAPAAAPGAAAGVPGMQQPPAYMQMHMAPPPPMYRNDYPGGQWAVQGHNHVQWAMGGVANGAGHGHGDQGAPGGVYAQEAVQGVHVRLPNHR